MLTNSGQAGNRISPACLTGRLTGKQKGAKRSCRCSVVAQGVPWGGHVLGREGQEWEGPCQVPLRPLPALGQGFFLIKPIKGRVCSSNCNEASSAALGWCQCTRAMRQRGFPLVFRRMLICLSCPFAGRGCELSPPAPGFTPQVPSSAPVDKPHVCSEPGSTADTPQPGALENRHI